MKNVHIHAKCEAFELFEIVKEEKAVRRLKQIRKQFEYSVNHFKCGAGTLVVKTGIHNPTLF